ncbi:MAG: hypothetical protein Q9183_004576, partial [Haloplaca sp. 2 TL-2023]
VSQPGSLKAYLHRSNTTLTERPTTYTVPGSGSRSRGRVTLSLDWHLTILETHETSIMMLRALNRIVDTTIQMSKGDEPILNGAIEFRSPALRLRAQDTVLLGGFTYGILAAAIRGLGELVDKWGGYGVDVRVFQGGKPVGVMQLDFDI